MSHIIFGEFETKINDINLLKDELKGSEVIVSFGDEINFYDDIKRMLKENRNDTYGTSFCLTTFNQRYNSEDLLFPYDKYDDDELFPEGEGREVFEKICLNNLQVLKTSIVKMKDVLEIKNIKIFVSGGYDDHFKRVECNLDEMINDIWEQVLNSFGLESKVYELNFE